MVSESEPPFDMTYLADAVLLVRYFEAAVEMRCAVSVVKKRTSAHKRFMRELYLDEHGLRVFPVLTGFEDILSSRRIYVGSAVPARTAGKRGAPLIGNDRVMILAPTGRDAMVIAAQLAAASTGSVIAYAAEIVDAARAGVLAAAIVADEAMANFDLAALASALSDQPP